MFTEFPTSMALFVVIVSVIIFENTPSSPSEKIGIETPIGWLCLVISTYLVFAGLTLANDWLISFGEGNANALLGVGGTLKQDGPLRISLYWPYILIGIGIFGTLSSIIFLKEKRWSDYFLADWNIIHGLKSTWFARVCVIVLMIFIIFDSNNDTDSNTLEGNYPKPIPQDALEDIVELTATKFQKLLPIQASEYIQLEKVQNIGSQLIQIYVSTLSSRELKLDMPKTQENLDKIYCNDKKLRNLLNSGVNIKMVFMDNTGLIAEIVTYDSTNCTE